MKRIAIWVTATLILLALLFGYRTSRQGALTSAPPSAISGSLGDPSVSAPGGPGSGTPPPGTRPDQQPTQIPTRLPTQPPATGPSGGSGTGQSTTVTGQVAQTVWGPVQVQLSVQGGKVTGVAVPVYPNGTEMDLQINSYALPVLVGETLQAQSARIDMVSGATITSGGYLQSLQSALDKAGL